MEITQLSFELLSLLFFVAIIAGLLDTLAGGGGLISIPALMLSGVPPLAALGTNKLQGSIGTATATYLMLKNKKVGWNHVKYLMLSAFIGSTLGTVVVQFINTEILTFVVPSVLLFIGMYFLLSNHMNKEPTRPKVSQRKFNRIVVPLIGCYDGMFGPGTGSFFTLSGMSCRGQDLITSTAMAKTLNFSSNLASLFVFLMAGHIIWAIGLVMMLGQVVGAWVGSHCLFSINPTYLRGIIVLMCGGMLVKYSHSMGWLNYF